MSLGLSVRTLIPSPRCRARGREAAAALDLNEAEAARAEGFQRVGRAELRHVPADHRGRAHDRRAFGHGDRAGRRSRA